MKHAKEAIHVGATKGPVEHVPRAPGSKCTRSHPAFAVIFSSDFTCNFRVASAFHWRSGPRGKFLALTGTGTVGAMQRWGQISDRKARRKGVVEKKIKNRVVSKFSSVVVSLRLKSFRFQKLGTIVFLSDVYATP